VADSELIVRLRGENADLKAKLAEVAAASKAAAGSMSASFKSALGAIGPAIGIAFSARAVINFAKESVAAFAEAEAAAASLKNTIANMGGTEIQGAGMQLWVDSLERMSGFKGDELSKALGMLIVQTGSGTKAQQALSVAMDLAATRGMSLSEAGNKVYLVMTGMTRTMKEFGMTTRDGATDMDYLKEMGAKMAGGLETNLTTVDGKLRMVTTSFHNLKEAIGEAMAETVSEGASGWTKFFNGIADSLNIGADLSKIFPDRPDLVAMMENRGRTYGAAWLKGYIDTVQGADNWLDVGMKGQRALSFGVDTGANEDALKKIAEGNADLIHKIFDLNHTVTQGKLHDIDLEVAAMRKAGYDEVLIATYVRDAKKAIYADTFKSGVFKSAWEPISLMGGNLSELTKYIGNLRQVNRVVLAVEVEVKGTGAKVSAIDAKKIATVVAPVVAAAVTHGQGWTPGSMAALRGAGG